MNFGINSMNEGIRQGSNKGIFIPEIGGNTKKEPPVHCCLQLLLGTLPTHRESNHSPDKEMQWVDRPKSFVRLFILIHRSAFCTFRILILLRPPS